MVNFHDTKAFTFRDSGINYIPKRHWSIKVRGFIQDGHSGKVNYEFFFLFREANIHEGPSLVSIPS